MMVDESSQALESGKFGKAGSQGISDSYDTPIIGRSPQILQNIRAVERLARQRVSTVLITGESGTGKELMARALHNNVAISSERPFVALSCSALHQRLLEGELFGYENSILNDAKGPQKGLFELADTGTLLLDEIGDMDVHFQGNLLRVLETRRVKKFGSAMERPLDIMVIATTNKDLVKMKSEGAFRSDLFYRLKTCTLKVPALRERKEDIPLLTEYFLEQFSKELEKFEIPPIQISKEALGVLMDYHWPGNVRELKCILTDIMFIEDTSIIRPEHILPRLESSCPQDDQMSTFFEKEVSLEEIEKNMLHQALLKANGNAAKAARLLNISYETLRYRIKKFGIT